MFIITLNNELSMKKAQRYSLEYKKISPFLRERFEEIYFIEFLRLSLAPGRSYAPKSPHPRPNHTSAWY